MNLGGTPIAIGSLEDESVIEFAIDTRSGVPSRRFSGPVVGYASSSKAHYVAMSRRGGGIAVANVDTGEIEWIETGSADPNIALHPSGRAVISASAQGSLRAWQLDALRSPRERSYPENPISFQTWIPLAFDRDGNRVAVGHTDGTVEVLSFPELSQLSTIRLPGTQVTALAFSPGPIGDNDLAIAALQPSTETHNAETKLYIWDTGRPNAKLQQATAGVVFSLTFAPDGSKLATSSGDGTVRIWSSEELRQEALFASGKRLSTWAGCNVVNDICFRGDTGVLLFRKSHTAQVEALAPQTEDRSVLQVDPIADRVGLREGQMIHTQVAVKNIGSGPAYWVALQGEEASVGDKLKFAAAPAIGRLDPAETKILTLGISPPLLAQDDPAPRERQIRLTVQSTTSAPIEQTRNVQVLIGQPKLLHVGVGEETDQGWPLTALLRNDGNAPLEKLSFSGQILSADRTVELGTAAVQTGADSLAAHDTARVSFIIPPPTPAPDSALYLTIRENIFPSRVWHIKVPLSIAAHSSSGVFMGLIAAFRCSIINVHIATLS
jgi:WD40 repeat protein